jgi:putative acetyltransferase
MGPPSSAVATIFGISVLAACAPTAARPVVSRYPVAVDPARVGTYPASAKSGAGYFYDDVLEYRVWVDSPNGDWLEAFATYEQAAEFSKATQNAEDPLVLVLQRESINEPEPGQYVHVTEPRVTEWQVEWLADSKRSADSIRRFLAEKQRKSGR